MLSCDVIIWDDNIPLFVFPGNFTHSTTTRQTTWGGIESWSPLTFTNSGYGYNKKAQKAGVFQQLLQKSFPPHDKSQINPHYIVMIPYIVAYFKIFLSKEIIYLSYIQRGYFSPTQRASTLRICPRIYINRLKFYAFPTDASNKC